MKKSYSVYQLLSFKSDRDEGILLRSSFVVLQKWPRLRDLTLFIICCSSKVTAMKKPYSVHYILFFKSDCDEGILLCSLFVVLKMKESHSVHHLLSFRSDCDEKILLCSSFVVLQKWLRWRNLTLFITCCPLKVTTMKKSYSVYQLLSLKSDQDEGILLCSSFVVLQKLLRWRNLTLIINCCPLKVTAMKESYSVHCLLSLRWRNLTLFIICCPSEVTAMKKSCSVHRSLSFKSGCDEGISLCSSLVVL